MKRRLTLSVLCVLPVLAVAEPVVSSLTEEQVEQEFTQASSEYEAQQAFRVDPNEQMEPDMYAPVLIDGNDMQVDSDQIDVEQDIYENPDEVMVDKDVPHYYAGFTADEVAMTKHPIMVDIQHLSLRDAIEQVVDQASNTSGPWKVRWRLKTENSYILEEKVNVIAETTFEYFIDMMIERVKNMTGVQLFVTMFDGGRVIVISDTYY